jgi:hypothetical protein
MGQKYFSPSFSIRPKRRGVFLFENKLIYYHYGKTRKAAQKPNGGHATKNRTRFGDG